MRLILGTRSEAPNSLQLTLNGAKGGFEPTRGLLPTDLKS
jgi:hypothetical protein